MASTFTNRLGLEKQTDGENPNSWGAILNTNVIDLIDDSIAGYEIVSVSGTGITLTDNNGSSDQSRNASLEFSGTLTANVTITIPSKEKIYFVRENSSGSFAVTMKTAGGSAITLSQNSNIFVACDGTELYTTGISTISSVTSFTANNLTVVTKVSANAASFSGQVSINNSTFTGQASITDATFTGQVVDTPVSLTDGATISVDLSQGNSFSVTLAGNRTLANPSNAIAGQTGQIYVVQDATGSRTLSFGDSYNFKEGSVPTMSTSINSVDLLIFNVREVSAIDTVFIPSFG